MKADWRKTLWKSIKTALVAGAGAAAVALAGDQSLVDVVKELPPWAAIVAAAALTAFRTSMKAR
jgi:hypothetical protein